MTDQQLFDMIYTILKQNYGEEDCDYYGGVVLADTVAQLITNTISGDIDEMKEHAFNAGYNAGYENGVLQKR
jgi:hypothetical protein